MPKSYRNGSKLSRRRRWNESKWAALPEKGSVRCGAPILTVPPFRHELDLGREWSAPVVLPPVLARRPQSAEAVKAAIYSATIAHAK